MHSEHEGHRTLRHRPRRFGRRACFTADRSFARDRSVSPAFRASDEPAQIDESVVDRCKLRQPDATGNGTQPQVSAGHAGVCTSGWSCKASVMKSTNARTGPGRCLRSRKQANYSDSSGSASACSGPSAARNRGSSKPAAIKGLAMKLLSRFTPAPARAKAARRMCRCATRTTNPASERRRALGATPPGTGAVMAIFSSQRRARPRRRAAIRP